MSLSVDFSDNLMSTARGPQLAAPLVTAHITIGAGSATRRQGSDTSDIREADPKYADSRSLDIAYYQDFQQSYGSRLENIYSEYSNFDQYAGSKEAELKQRQSRKQILLLISNTAKDSTKPLFDVMESFKRFYVTRGNEIHNEDIQTQIFKEILNSIPAAAKGIELAVRDEEGRLTDEKITIGQILDNPKLIKKYMEDPKMREVIAKTALDLAAKTDTKPVSSEPLNAAGTTAAVIGMGVATYATLSAIVHGVMAVGASAGVTSLLAGGGTGIVSTVAGFLGLTGPVGLAILAISAIALIAVPFIVGEFQDASDIASYGVKSEANEDWTDWSKVIGIGYLGEGWGHVAKRIGHHLEA